MAVSAVDIAKLESLANALTQGLETLLAEVRRRQEDELKQFSRYKCTAAQLAQACKNGSPNQSLVDDLQRAVAHHDRVLTAYVIPPSVTEVLKAREAGTNMPKPAGHSAVQRCPASKQTQDPEDMEIDFTTHGVQGSLECPFAKMKNRLPVTPNSLDPIAAEFHPDHVSLQNSDVPANSKCPIRFLDQHSPEEVAKYFENHKHEIPRSHEICVKRYQQNEHSIRQLDAKYGNLVNMIQGLGVKHKQYLPEKGHVGTSGAEADEQGEDRTSIQAVEKWAENVSQPADAEPVDLALDEEDRVPRLEKPLREVRVGESPSRPWGISVPPAPDSPRSAPRSDHRVLASSMAVPANPASEPAQPKPRACPFGHGEKARETTGEVHGVEQSSIKNEQHPTMAKDMPSAVPQIVFNGPVFFGYSPEQATAFLQSTSLGSLGK